MDDRAAIFSALVAAGANVNAKDNVRIYPFIASGV